MDRRTQAKASPTEGLWKRFMVLVPLIAVLVVSSYLYIKPKVSTYTKRGILAYTEAEIRDATVEMTEPGVVEVEDILLVSRNHPVAQVSFHALADGETEATLVAGGKKEMWQLEVRDGAIIEGGVNFEGWQAIQVSLCVLLGTLATLFASGFVKLWRASWYGYTMVACGGGFLFCFFQLLFYTAVLLVLREPSFYFFLMDVSLMVDWFVALSVYPMLPLSLLVSISNISLVRHEGMRPVNLLGIAASAVWIVVYGYWTLAYHMPSDVMGYLLSLIPVAMAYGECLLFSVMVCAWLAARHVPQHGADYLVVLGCGIRADGTPCPLLAGRVDRAAAFDEGRTATGDAPVVFVPSGGQGPDEPISEAQSMSTYLQTHHGVAPDRIALEDRSTTTRENMAFSREVIERHARRDVADLRVVFSTTNYHVFRGYVCGHQAGMRVEGLGAKTKYYFWPNAFLREFVGLLVTRWKPILQTLVIISAFYVLSSYALSLAMQ